MTKYNNMAERSIESISQTNGSINKDTGIINTESSSLIDGDWIDGIELNDENTSRIAGKVKESMGDYYAELIDKVSTLVTLLGGKENPDGTTDTKEAEEKNEAENEKPSQDEKSEDFKELGESIKNAIFGEETDLTSDFQITNKTSGVTADELNDLPLGLGSGFALLYETLEMILSEMRKKNEGVENKPDEGENAAKLSFKDLMGNIGSSYAALAVGLVSFSIALLALQAVDPGTIALAVGIVAGLYILTTKMVELSLYIEAWGVEDALNTVTNTFMKIGLTMAASVSAVAIGAFAINQFGVGAVIGGVILTLGMALLSLGGTVLLTNYIEDNIDDDTFQTIANAMDQVSGVMTKISIGLIVAAAAGLIVSLLGMNTVMLPLIVAGVLLGSLMYVGSSIDDEGANAIRAVGQAMIMASVSLLLISAALLVAGFVGAWLSEDETRMTGVTLVLTTAGVLLAGLIVLGIFAQPEPITAAGIAMLLGAVSLAAIAGALFIAGYLGQWLSEEQSRYTGVKIVLITAALLLTGLIVVGLIGQAAMEPILMGAVVMALASASLLLIGLAFLAIGQALQMAGGGIEGANALGNAALIMISITSLMVVALAGLGFLFELVGFMAAGLAVIGLASAGLALVALPFLTIAQVISEVGDAQQTMSLGITAMIMIASLTGIASSLAAFGVASIFFLASLPAALVGLAALSPVINQVAVVAQQIAQANEQLGPEVEQSIRRFIVLILGIDVLAMDIALMGVVVSSLAPLMALGTIGLDVLGLMTRKIAETVSGPISELGEIENGVFSQALLTILSISGFALAMSAAGIAIAFAAALLTPALIGLVAINVAVKAASETAKSIQSIADTGLSESLNALADDIDNIRFGLPQAIRLRAALSSLQFAFGGPLLNSGSIASTMEAVSKSIEGLNSIEKVADGFERLASLSEPLNEVAASMREVAAAAKDISEANIPEALEGLKDFKQPEEIEEPQKLQQAEKSDNGISEKLDELISLMNTLANSMSSMARSNAGIMNAAATSDSDKGNKYSNFVKSSKTSDND